MQKLLIGVFLTLILLIAGCTQTTTNANTSTDQNNEQPKQNTQPICGNGNIEAEENCSNCAADVKCPQGKKCKTGICQEIQEIQTTIGKEFELLQGETTNIAKKQITFIGILTVSGAEEENKARLEVDGETVDLGTNEAFELNGLALKLNELDETLIKVKLIVQEKTLFCGNTIAEDWETCTNCAVDVVCASNETCDTGVCIKTCQSTCCDDTDCDDGNENTTDSCKNPDTNSAVCQNLSTSGGTGTGSYVNMITPAGTSVNYFQGDTFNVTGKGDYSGDSLLVRFDGIVQLGGGQPLKAKFSLIRVGEVLTTQTIDADTQVQFYDGLQDEMIDSYVYLNSIQQVIG